LDRRFALDPLGSLQNIFAATSSRPGKAWIWEEKNQKEKRKCEKGLARRKKTLKIGVLYVPIYVKICMYAVVIGM